METSDVRKRVHAMLERAKQRGADRRARADAAGKAYAAFLETIAIPVFRQVANVLRAEGYSFAIFTPSGSVRLMSDKTAEDFVELVLDTSDETPRVMSHASRSRGRRVIESEHPVGDPASLTEHDVLEFLMKELEALVER